MTPLQDMGRLDITPKRGSFDVERIAARVAELGMSFRDEHDPSRFVVTSDAAARDAFQAARRADPEGRFPYVLLIGATPERVFVAPSMFEADEPLQIEFLGWLAQNFLVRIDDTNGEEVTELIKTLEGL